MSLVRITKNKVKLKIENIPPLPSIKPFVVFCINLGMSQRDINNSLILLKKIGKINNSVIDFVRYGEISKVNRINYKLCKLYKCDSEKIIPKLRVLLESIRSCIDKINYENNEINYPIEVIIFTNGLEDILTKKEFDNYYCYFKSVNIRINVIFFGYSVRDLCESLSYLGKKEGKILNSNISDQEIVINFSYLKEVTVVRVDNHLEILKNDDNEIILNDNNLNLEINEFEHIINKINKTSIKNMLSDYGIELF